MKFVKENLSWLIAALVMVLLAVAAFVYPVPGWIDDLRTEMKGRLGQRTTINQMSQTSLVLPGLTAVKGVPSPDYIKAKKDAIETIEAQKKNVEEAGRKANAQGRVNNGVPILPVPGTAGLPQADFLPRIKGNAIPMKYKAEYVSQFRLWVGQLSKGSPADLELDAAMPPSSDVLKSLWDDRKAKSVVTGMAPPNPNQDAEAFNDFQKQTIMNKAADLRMFVERYAFQIRPWALEDASPTEAQIFESLVDSWIQSDVVKAIAATNLIGNPSANDHVISRSPVKRLTRIVVGNAGRTNTLSQATVQMGNNVAGIGPAGEPGPLFLTSGNAMSVGGSMPLQGLPTGGGGGAAAAAEANVPDNVIDYAMGMSGRSAGKEYDMVMMDIIIDIDPNRLNTFIEQLYKQNMGYTVSGIQIKTVDPLDRASSGYLYGEGQVVEAEIHVECLFFRSWLSPLMPDTTRVSVGLPMGRP